MAEEMVQQQERPEEEGARHEKCTDVQEDAAGRPHVCDSLEECGPLERKRLEIYLPCLGNQLDEEDEEDPSQDSQNDGEEVDVDETSVQGSQENIWSQAGGKHGQPLEAIVIVVASVYGEGQETGSPQAPRPESPRDSNLEQESCFHMGREELQDSCSSTGYYPCYNTFSSLCEAEDPPKPPGRRDVGIQVGETLLNHAGKGDGGLEEGPTRKETQKDPHAPQEGSLPPSPEEASAINSEGPELAKMEEAVGTPAAPSTSRRSVQGFLQWVRNAFRRNSAPRPEPSPAPERKRRRRPLGSRLCGWIRKHRGHVQPC